MSAVPDVARIRLSNALRLFDEFVQATVKSPDAATLRGLERRFAERLLIQPSYWSQLKSGGRQIGERLARQFEQQCRKPAGWLDRDPTLAAPAAQGQGPGAADAPTAGSADRPFSQPLDDDERFIVGLVLTYYRRHPARARARLLDLLGEVLAPTPSAGGNAPAGQHGAAGEAPAPARPAAGAPQGAQRPPEPDDRAAWQRVQAGIAPLKRKP